MSLIEKLKNIQSELKAPKNQKNSFGNYNYRSCEDILEAVKPLLFKYGCALTISDNVVERCGEPYVESTVEFHDEEGDDSINVSAFAKHPEEQKGMSPSQITGAASSYARKYALNGMFCIDDAKDADTQDNTDVVVKKTIKTKSVTNDFSL